MRVRTGTNGEQLPLVIGFPLPLVFAHWYATYWVKMPSDIEMLDQPDTNYWTKVAYTIPDFPHVSIKRGKKMLKMIPINRMVPRYFVTNIASGSRVQAAAPTTLRGIAFGGDCGVDSVDFSIGRGRNWHQALEHARAVEVSKMINNYKAPIAPEDIGTIIESLAALRGAK